MRDERLDIAGTVGAFLESGELSTEDYFALTEIIAKHRPKVSE